jgi:hypothetical protein
MKNLKGRELERPKRGWKENIKPYLTEMGYKFVCIHLAQYKVKIWALVNTVMHLPFQ